MTPTPVVDWSGMTSGITAAMAADPLAAILIMAALICGAAFYLIGHGRKVVK